MIDPNGLTVMLALAGSTIEDLTHQLDGAHSRIAEQDATIADLREKLAEARRP